MTENIQFETPENVEVSYEVAGLGSRFAAWLIDQVLVTLVVVVLFVAMIVTGIAGEVIADEFQPVSDEEAVPEFLQFMIGLAYLLYGLGGVIYFGTLELLMRGQTIGKRRMRIRVTQSSGFTLRPGSILLRTIFRITDHLPPMWIVPLVSSQQRRLGDIVGGTVVIQESAQELSSLREDVLETEQRDATFRFPGSALSRVTDAEVTKLERIMERVAGSQDAQHLLIIKDVTVALANKMQMDIPEPSQHELFLREFLAARYRREYRRLG